MSFAHNVGVPAELISDHANLLIGPKSDYAKKAQFLNIKQTSCEPRTQQQNKFEGETILLKCRWKKSDDYQQLSSTSVGLCSRI